MNKLLSYLWLLLALATLSSLQAETPVAKEKPAEGPRTVKLTLTAAAEPRPALRYQLLPAMESRQPGNAAPYYYRAIMQLISLRNGNEYKEFEKNWEQWKNPTQPLPLEQVRTNLNAFRTLFAEIQVATHREMCDWDWRTQDLRGIAVFEFRLSEMQEARSIARLLAIKARCEIQEGKEHEALETLQMGYQLARDTASQPFLINGLVGIAIAATLNEPLLELMDRPASPNLYWAIAALPRPLVDLRPSLVNEMSFYERVFPQLKSPEEARHSAEEWERLLKQQFDALLHMNAGAGEAGFNPESREKLLLGLPAAVINAKKELLAQGFATERVEAMSPAQALSIQSSQALRYTADEFLKFHLLDSYDQAERVAEVEQRLEKEGYLAGPLQGKEPFGIGKLLFPALSKASASGSKLKRNLAALQTIEALRMHAAQHAGKLPATLDEIKIIPVPLNPATGKPFPYMLVGTQAILEVPPVSQPADATIYEIEIEAGK